jgi:excisionase family DNA binding protein
MESLLLSAEDSAELLGIGRTLFYSMHSSGRLGPMPVKLGRRVLWNRKELEAWVRAKCPARKIWQNLIHEKKACALD